MIYFFYIISLLSIYYIYLYKSYYSLITIFVCLALFLSLIRKNYSTKLNFLVLLVSIIGLFIINHNIINLYFIDLKKYVEKEFIVYLIIIFGFSLILFTFFKYNGKKIILSILIPIIIFFQFILIVFAKYIQKLSISSIQETSNLNINETIFFVKNLLINNLSLNIELIYTILLSIIIYFISFLFFPKYSSKDKSNFFLLVSFFSISIFFMNYLVLKNKLSQKLQLDMIVSIEEIQKDDILKVKENINNLDKINIINDNDNIDIILLISESISSNFMSLYGYHNNNNYNLENELKNGNLIKFDNVFSTHTHTGRSLTNIFSKFDNSQKLNVPSYELKKYSLIDILKKANVFLKVFSNTELSGSTKKFYQNHFNKSDVLLNENNYDEYSFFKKQLENSLNDNKESLFILHSNLGHFTSRSNSSIEKQYSIYEKKFNSKALTGNRIVDKNVIIKRLDRYNSDIEEIDTILFKIINKIKKRNKQTILIYTSDHGESIFSNNGHDANNFEIEMSQVPLLIYFNDEAKKRNYDKFEFLLDISKKKTISFNENIKNLILQIFNINIDKKFKNNNTVGVENLERQFVIRDFGDKYLYYSFADNEINNVNEESKSYKDYNDQIALKLISNKFQNPICYHRSNTVGKILRAISVTNCIEIDLNFIDENLYIYHPSAENTFFNLEDLKVLTKKKKDLKIWIDIKNIDFNNCVLLNKKIDDLNFDYNNLFLEFPPDTENKIKDINLFNCLKKLNNKTNVSYYIPTAIGINCLNEINNLKLNHYNCNEFLRIINSIKNSGIFSNISFDYNIYDLINYYQLNNFFILNTWAVNPHNINSVEFGKFNYIIFDVKDINNL